MQGTYWLTVAPETSQLRPMIKKALRGVDSDAVIRPTYDTKGARRAGEQAGRDVQSGMESTTRGGGLGKLLRIDGARGAGQNAGREINAGIASANIGSGASSQLAANLTSGAAALGRRMGSLIGGGLKIAAVSAGTVAATGLGAALHAGFSRLTAIDDAKFKLQGLGNSTEKVQGIMDNALAAVKGTAFGLDEAATTASTAVAAGIQPGEQLTKYLKLTADTAAIAGTSLADMGGIFNKVQTSGKAFTGDLNMLADRGLPVFTWLQEATGKTGEDFQKMVEEGGISAELFQSAVANNIAGAAQSMGGSVRGSLSNLRASFSRFGAELSGPIFAGLKPLAIGLTGVFDSVTTAIKPVMADLTARVGPWADALAAKMKAWADNGGIDRIVAQFGRLATTVKGWVDGGGMQKIVDWFSQLKSSMSGMSSDTGGASTLSAIADSAKQLGPALQQAAPALAGVADSAKAFGAAILQVGPETLSAVLVPALQLLAMTLKFVADNASWAVPTIVGLVAAVGAFRAAGQTLGPIVGFLNGAFRVINAPLVLAQTAAIRAQASAMTQLTAALGANTVSATTNTVAQNANAATTARGRIATMAAAAASKVAAAAQWLWNAALTANPIGLIIAGVVAAGVAIWAFFTKTETGRKLWDKIWTGIKTTVSTVWEWLKSTLSTAWAQIGPSVMKIGDVAKQAFGAFVGAVKTVWTAIQPAVAWVGRLWVSVAKLEFGAAIGALKALGAVIGWLWTNVVVPAFSGIATAVQAWWSGVQVVWGAATTAVGWVGDKVMWLWNTVAVPAFAAIGAAVSTWWDGVKAIWGLFTTALDNVGKGVGVLKDGFVTAFNAIKDVVTTVWNTISGIIDKIGNGIGTVVDKLRNIPVLGNFIPGHAEGKPPGFAGGSAGVSTSGLISGPGTGTSDSILALVSNGEGIVKTSAMAGGGATVVAALNAGWVPSASYLHGLIPGFADGRGPDIAVAENLVGTKYSQSARFDCSGSVARVINGALGMDGGLMTTKNARSWLSARGFVDGSGGPGQIRVGWYDHGPNPNDGHMAMTLSDGRNAESGGSHGAFLIGAGAAGADDSQFDNHMYLPQVYGEGAATGSTSLGGLTSASSAGSSARVSSAQTAARDAGQAVDDRTYARDKAQRRLDELKAAGKDTADAQHSLDVANRELADAKDKQTRANDKLTDAQNTAATDMSAAGGKSGGGFDDLGKSIAGGIFESFGLDGSLLSNPFEWPTIKSAMAGVNILGKALMGGTGTATAGGAGGDPSGVLGGLADATGLGDMLTNLNPGSDVAAPAVNVAPDTTQHGDANGANPGPMVYIENAGMSPRDVENRLTAQFNARTRTTKVR